MVGPLAGKGMEWDSVERRVGRGRECWSGIKNWKETEKNCMTRGISEQAKGMHGIQQTDGSGEMVVY